MVKIIWRNCKEQQIWHNNCFHLFAEFLTSSFSLVPFRLLLYIYFSCFSERSYDKTPLWLWDYECNYVKIYYILPSPPKSYLFWWARNSTEISGKKFKYLDLDIHAHSHARIHSYIQNHTFSHLLIFLIVFTINLSNLGLNKLSKKSPAFYSDSQEFTLSIALDW